MHKFLAPSTPKEDGKGKAIRLPTLLANGRVVEGLEVVVVVSNEVFCVQAERTLRGLWAVQIKTLFIRYVTESVKIAIMYKQSTHCTEVITSRKKKHKKKKTNMAAEVATDSGTPRGSSRTGWRSVVLRALGHVLVPPLARQVGVVVLDERAVV